MKPGRDFLPGFAGVGSAALLYHFLEVFINAQSLPIWCLQSHRFPKDEPERIHINTEPIVVATNYFWRHVPARASQPRGFEAIRGLDKIFFLQLFSETEIKKHVVASKVHSDIVRLEVTKDEAGSL